MELTNAHYLFLYPQLILLILLLIARLCSVCVCWRRTCSCQPPCTASPPVRGIRPAWCLRRRSAGSGSAACRLRRSTGACNALYAAVPTHLVVSCRWCAC